MTSSPQGPSDLDALFLSAETPAQHLHVLAAVVLDRSGVRGGWDYETFQSRIAERFHLIQPLRRRPVWGALGRPLLVDDPDIHLSRHLHHVVVAEGGGLDALAEVAGEIASHPLSRDRPLWEAWFVEGFEKDHVALIAKIHHSAVDGVFGIFALAEFFDLDPVHEAASGRHYEPLTSSRLSDLLSAKITGLGRRPMSVVRAARRAAGSAVTFATLRGDRPPLPLSGPRMSYNRALTARRSVSFTTLQLDDVKEVGKTFGASVNDVVVALSAGVLRRFAIQRDELPERPLVAAIPVSERSPDDEESGNQLSFMFYSLPVHLGDAAERIEFVRRSARSAKEVHARAGQSLLASVAGLFPKVAVGSVMRTMSSLRAGNLFPPIANAMVSSIRGPEIPLYMAGARLRSMFPLGPVIEGIGLGITAISYGEELGFGFIACSDLVSDVRELSTGLHLEMAAMLDSTSASGPK